MTKQGFGEFNLCLKEANHFYELAHFLDKDDPMDLLSGTCYPFAVNISLACELYMKAILIHFSDEDAFPQDHNLKLLFDKLPKNLKAIIAKEVSDEVETINAIEDFLNTQKDTFVKWRYAFERNKDDNVLDYSGFIFFSKSLKRIANELASTNK